MDKINSNTPAMSEDIRALAAAFLLAKKDFKATGLAGENTHTRNKYAKIGDIYRAVEEALARQHIIIWHFDVPADGIEYLHTRLVHSTTGQFIEDRRILESEKPGNQAKGAANTYMKKYALLSLCSIATEDDDDGQDEEQYMVKNNTGSFISAAQLKELADDIQQCTNGTLLYGNIKNIYKVPNLSQLKASSFDSVKAYVVTNGE